MIRLKSLLLLVLGLINAATTTPVPAIDAAALAHAVQFVRPAFADVTTIGSTLDIAWRRGAIDVEDLSLVLESRDHSADDRPPITLVSALQAHDSGHRWDHVDAPQGLYTLALFTANGTAVARSDTFIVQLQDPCAALDGFQTIAPIQTSLACLDTVPYDPAVATALITTIRNSVLQTYVFRDISKNITTAEDSTSVDLEHALNRIQSSSHFDTDRDFHESLYDLFQRLHDGHTQYTSDCHNQAINWYQPFILASTVAAGNGSHHQSIHIEQPAFESGETGDIHFNAFGINATDYLGWEVLAIDGIDAVTAIQTFASSSHAHAGGVRDGGVAFNVAIGRYEYLFPTFQLFYGSWTVRTRAPTRHYVVYTVRDPNSGSVVDVRAPFAAANFAFGAFTDSDSFRVNVCSNAPSTASSSRSLDSSVSSAPSEPATHVVRRFGRPLIQGRDFRPVELGPQTSGPTVLARSNPQAPTLIYSDYFVSFWTFEDQSTAVLKLSQIDGGPDTLKTIDRQFAKLQASGVKKLIIDIAENAGGDVCIVYGLLNHLLPKSFRPFNSDLLVSPLELAMTQSAASSPDNLTETIFNYRTYWVDTQTGEKPANADWLTSDRKTYKRGGSKAEYTARRAVDCRTAVDGTVDYYAAMTPTSEPPFSIENIKILTNGNCVSSCALFARYLHDLAGVKAYVTGGVLSSEKIAFSQTPGGQVTYLDSYDPAGFSGFAFDLSYLNVSQSPLAPQPLAAPSYLSWTIVEAYLRDDQDMPPMEFVPSFADTRIWASTPSEFRDPYWRWRTVMESS